MAIYIVQVDLSDNARADIASLPTIIRSEFELAEQAGVTLHGLYLTLGPHDVMCIFDAPSDDVALAGLLQVNTLGLGRTETVRAYTFDEFEAAASQLG
jgi:uncharacterized protein with GYD domain